MWDPNWYESAHERLKARHSRYLFCSAVVALILTGVGAVLSPPYVPAPYVYVEPTPPDTLLPPPPIVVPPEPKPVPRPELPMDFEPSDDPGAIQTIPLTVSPFPLVAPLAPAGPPEMVPLPETQPTVVLQITPEYPEIARAAQAEGTVEVQVAIDRDGRVTAARIYASDTIEALEAAALDAARQFLFTPCMQNDVPVPCQMVLRFSFYLD